MFYFLFALLMGMVCPSDTSVKNGDGTVYTTNGGGTGGDTGQVPPRPPRP